MIKSTLFTLALGVSSIAFAQYPTIWPATTTSNGTPAGYAGLGIKAVPGNSTLPDFNFQVHGVTDYSETIEAEEPPKETGMDLNTGTPGSESNYTPKASINYGKTSRIGLTNSTTGITAKDGAMLRMSEYDFTIRNREKGEFYLEADGVGLTLSGSTNRAWIGLAASSDAEFGRFNVMGADNGMYIRTSGLGKYGLSIRSSGATDNAIQVMGTNGSTRNFAVKANGEVFARKYTTTLAAIPDYVFDESYDLMPLTELRMYLAANKHLPNVPSAKEYEENGVDLGEMNRVLLEKTEELTLYILQLEERLKKLEEKQ